MVHTLCVVCHHVRMTVTDIGVDRWVPELTFGARLALIRQAMQWNIKEAAKECGLPATSWRQWEVAGHLPRRYVDTCKAIATRTGVDYHWLIDGTATGPDGGTRPTRQYFEQARLVATVGTTDSPSGRRPVRRTRPRAAAGSRPLTAVAA